MISVIFSHLNSQIFKAPLLCLPVFGSKNLSNGMYDIHVWNIFTYMKLVNNFLKQSLETSQHKLIFAQFITGTSTKAHCQYHKHQQTGRVITPLKSNFLKCMINIQISMVKGCLKSSWKPF